MSEPAYHVLLVGIDAYPSPVRPLRGCVNDIDAVQELLVDAGLSPERITRLASPHPEATHSDAIAGAPATLENLRVALKKLGSDRVEQHDRVFIYFSGHGGRGPVEAGAHTYTRESLVPCDVDAGDPSSPARVLLDHEFNQLLTQIARRTTSISVVLDCCHAAGATRGESTARALDLKNVLPGRPSPRLPDASSPTTAPGFAGAAAATVDACQVVAACMNHEVAFEDDEGGVHHGAFTRAFVAALRALDPRTLLTAPWGRIWSGIRAELEKRRRPQHVWISGGLARTIFGGPPVDADVGFAVARAGERTFRIDAGTLAGVTVGAKFAVYGPDLPHFPPLGGPADLAARLVPDPIVVTRADRTSATAEAARSFDPPPGARARLIQPAAAERLRCAVVPPDRSLVDEISRSSALRLVADPADAEVRLERRDDAQWALRDDLHGLPLGTPDLFALTLKDGAQARRLLEHYDAYSRPLRMARRCTDLPDVLRVDLLQAPSRDLEPARAQITPLPEIPRVDQHYALTQWQKYAIRVHNRWSAPLRVTVLHCRSDGTVECLYDQSIGRGRSELVWRESHLGRAFLWKPASGPPHGVDRLIAIGTTAQHHDLKMLCVRNDFARATQLSRGDKDFGPPDDVPPTDLWTATETLIRTSA